VWPRMDAARAVGEPSSLKSSLRFCSAGKKPGVIALTRTFFGAHSRARNCVRLTTAALAAEYATTRESGMPADTLPMLMMLPLPRLTMPGPNSWHGNNHTADEVSNQNSQPVSHGDLFKFTLTRNGHFRIIATGGIDENRRRAKGLFDFLMRILDAFGGNGISGKNCPLPPSSRMRLTQASPRSALRPSTATFARAWPKPSAMAPPKAPVAPMTTATSPVRSNKFIICVAGIVGSTNGLVKEIYFDPVSRLISPASVAIPPAMSIHTDLSLGEPVR